MNRDKMKLSRNILDMKFMKRTKEKVENLEYQKEGEEYFENQLTSRMKKESGHYIIEPSFVFCEGLIEGRFSYQGTNPELERIMENEQAQKIEDMEKMKEKDVSDETMVQWNTKHKIDRRHSKKDKIEEPDIKKRKFLKPSD